MEEWSRINLITGPVEVVGIGHLMGHEHLLLTDLPKKTRSFEEEQSILLEALKTENSVPFELIRLAGICAWCRDLKTFGIECPELHLDPSCISILAECLVDGDFERCWLHTRSGTFLDIMSAEYWRRHRGYGGLGVYYSVDGVPRRITDTRELERWYRAGYGLGNLYRSGQLKNILEDQNGKN